MGDPGGKSSTCSAALNRDNLSGCSSAACIRCSGLSNNRLIRAASAKTARKRGEKVVATPMRRYTSLQNTLLRPRQQLKRQRSSGVRGVAGVQEPALDGTGLI